ncbi:MAG TPA: bifunctional nuclease family protein [Armatimonadota bacterium]|nr:bifunctional nuclease family protein [Armatimonadota bacterium]
MKEGDEEFEGSSEEQPPEGQSEDSGLEGIDDLLTSEIENRQPRRLDEKEVEVVGVYEHQEQGMPSGYSPPAFVLLRDKQNRQVLIWVGRFEAYAISVALESVASDRPMTHDLLKNVLDRLGGKVERVLIDDLWRDTYYAKITVSMNGNTMDIDSRPSDAIALALRAKVPIYMAESVLEQASVDEEV